MRAFAVAWDRKCYLKEGYEHLEDKEVYGQGPNDSLVLVNIIIKALEKIRSWGILSKDTLNYVLVKDPEFARLYL